MIKIKFTKVVIPEIVAYMTCDFGEPIPDYRCPECGFGVADDYTYCPNCGSEMDWKTEKAIEQVEVGEKTMGKYLEMPWNTEDTIENLKEIKEHLQKCVILSNHDGRGKKDAEEVAFDFDRAINALQKQVQEEPYIESDGDADGNPVRDYYCPSCKEYFDEYQPKHCWKCGQAIKWSKID